MEALHLLENGVMPDNANSNNRPKRYPAELKERAVRMVFETIEQTGERQGAVARVAHSLGIGVESLRNWVRQAEIDRGTKAGLTTEERRRIVELERENRELRRANEILKSAAIFFGAELDRRSTK
jgi:transposase